jgi:hypothetical protein
MLLPRPHRLASLEGPKHAQRTRPVRSPSQRGLRRARGRAWCEARGEREQSGQSEAGWGVGGRWRIWAACVWGVATTKGSGNGMRNRATAGCVLYGATRTRLQSGVSSTLSHYMYVGATMTLFKVNNVS